MTLYLATCETRNFSFTCVGVTPVQATEGLRAGLIRHAGENNLSEAWADQQDVNVDTLTAGVCMRDHESV